jgi:hypothetical protein
MPLDVVCRMSMPAKPRLAFLLAACAITTVLLAPAARAEVPRVVIVDAEPLQLPAPHDKTNLANELRSAVASAGCEVVRVCRGLDCGVVPAAARDATVLSFTGRYDASRFTCSLKLEVRGRGGDSRQFSENPVCPASQLVSDARDAGRRACNELRGAKTIAQGQGEGREPAERSAQSTPPIDLSSTTAPDPGFGARRWLGVGATVAGLGLGALGVLQLLEQGDPSQCSTSDAGDRVCTSLKRRPLAIPLIAVGALATGVGLWQAFSADVTHEDGLTMVTAQGRF